MVRAGDEFDPGQAFEFMKSYRAQYSVLILSLVLGVSPSGYYAWLKRQNSRRSQADRELGDRLEALHRKSRSNYGRPRLQWDLRDASIRVSDKRVARLMRERNIVGAGRRKAFTTTVRDHTARPAPDLVDRKFCATGPNELWVSDITMCRRQPGFSFWRSCSTS